MAKRVPSKFNPLFGEEASSADKFLEGVKSGNFAVTGKETGLKPYQLPGADVKAKPKYAAPKPSAITPEEAVPLSQGGATAPAGVPTLRKTTKAARPVTTPTGATGYEVFTQPGNEEEYGLEQMKRGGVLSKEGIAAEQIYYEERKRLDELKAKEQKAKEYEEATNFGKFQSDYLKSDKLTQIDIYEKATKNTPMSFKEFDESMRNMFADKIDKSSGAFLRGMTFIEKAESGLLSDAEKQRQIAMMGAEKFNENLAILQNRYRNRQEFLKDIIESNRTFDNVHGLEGTVNYLGGAIERGVKGFVGSTGMTKTNALALGYSAISGTQKGKEELAALQAEAPELSALEKESEKGVMSTIGKVAGDLAMYGTMGVGLGATSAFTRALPKGIARFANNSPHLYDYVVGGLASEAVASGVAKIKNEDYGYQDFLLGMAMNGLGEGLGKALGSRKVSIMGEEGEKVASKFTFDDIEKIDNAVKIEYSKNPYATVTEIQDAINSVKLSNGKSVGELWYDVKSQKASAEFVEGAVRASDVGKIRTAEEAVIPSVDELGTTAKTINAQPGKEVSPEEIKASNMRSAENEIATVFGGRTSIKKVNKEAAIQNVMKKYGVTNEEARTIVRNVVEKNKPWNREVNADFNVLLGASILGEGDKMLRHQRPHRAIDASLPKDLKYDNIKTKDLVKAQSVRNLVENGMLEISTPSYKNKQTLLSFKVTEEGKRFLPTDKVEKISKDMQFVHIPESHYKLTEGNVYSKPYANPEVDERMMSVNFSAESKEDIESLFTNFYFDDSKIQRIAKIGENKYGFNRNIWSQYNIGMGARAIQVEGDIVTGNLASLIRDGKTNELLKGLEKYLQDVRVIGITDEIEIDELQDELTKLIKEAQEKYVSQSKAIPEEMGKKADAIRLGIQLAESNNLGLADSIARNTAIKLHREKTFFHEISHLLNTYLPNDVLDVIKKDYLLEREKFVSDLSLGDSEIAKNINFVLDNYGKDTDFFTPKQKQIYDVIRYIPSFYRFTSSHEFFAEYLAEAMVRANNKGIVGKICTFIIGAVESILNKFNKSIKDRNKFFDSVLSDFRNGRIQSSRRDAYVMRGGKSVNAETGVVYTDKGDIKWGLKDTKNVGELETGFNPVKEELPKYYQYSDYEDYFPGGENYSVNRNIGSIKEVGTNKQIIDGGVTEASVREYLAKNGIMSVPSRTSNRISKILNFVEELSQKATKEAKSIDDAINAAMRPVSNAYEGFRSEYLQRVVALGDDIDIYKVRKIEKELGQKYGIKSLPRDSKAEIFASDIIDNGWRLVARAGKTKKDFFETAKKLFDMSSGNDSKRLLQKWSEETDMKNLEPELRKYAEERGVKLDETKLGDADYVYNVIKEGDDRLFKNATANILRRVSNKYRKTEAFAQLQVEKLSNLKNLRAGAKEIKGMVNTLFDTEFRMLPKSDRERLVAFANEKALNLKSLERGNSTSLDNPENIISKVAEKAARAEYKFIDKSIQDNVNALFKAATDDDKVFIGGIIENGYEAFKNEGDLEALRKTLSFLENARKEGIENVKKNRFFMDSMVESALHSFTGGVKLNGRYGLRDGLTPNGGEIMVGQKGTQATFTSRTKFGLSMIDMPSRVLKATFGRDSFFYNRIYMPVVRAQKAAEGEIARFQQYIGYEGLKRDDMYSLMVYMNAKQSDGYQALLGASNLQVDKTTRKIITGNLSDRIKIKAGIMEPVQITEADINAIVHRVENDKKLKSVADRIFATTYDLGQRITNIAKMFGESFSAGENYIPRFYLRGEFEGTLGEVDKNMGSFSITEMDKSFFKPRTGLPEKGYELNMDFVSMIREIEKHILFANLRVPLKIFSDVAYKSDDYVSKGTKKYLNLLTEEYATQGASRERFGNNVIRGLERLGAFRALTSFKSVLMQFTSAFDVLGGTGIYDAFRTDGNIKRFMDNLSIARLHSGALNRRRATDLPDVAARAKLEGSTTRAIQEVESLLHAPMKGADAMTFNVSWMNFYSKFMREKRGFKGMVDLRTQGIDMDAVDYADEMSEEFLSSTRVGSTPLGYRNPYVRMMTFLGKSQLNSFMNMLDTINAKDLEGTPGEVYAYKARVAMGYALSRSAAALVGYANFYFWNQYYQEKVKKGEAVTMSDLNEFQTKVLKQTEDYIDGKLKVTELDEVGKYLVSDMVYQMLPHAALKDVLTYTAKNLPNDFDEAFSQKALLSNPVIDFIKNVSNIGTILAPKEDEEVQHSLSAQITQALTFVMPSFVASAVKIEGRTEDYKFKVSKGFEGRLDEGSTYEEYKQQIINKADSARINKTYKDWEKEAYKKVFRNPQELLDEIAKAPAEVKHKLDLGRIVNGKFVPSPEVEGDYLTKFAENQFTSYVEKRILNSNDWNKKFKYGDETLLKFVAPSVSVEDFYDWKLRGKDARQQTIVIKKLYNMVDVFGKVQGNDVKVPFESKIKSLEDYAKKTRYYEYKASQKQ